MKFARTSIILVALLMPACGNLALQLTGGSATKIDGLNASSDGTSFSDRCGLKIADVSTPGHVIVDQQLTTTPIVFKGESAGISYEITLEGKLHIVAVGGGLSTQETKLRVMSVKADDEGRFTKGQAEKAAYENSMFKTTWGMSQALLLKLQQTDEAFKGVECAVTFTAKAKTETPLGTGVITFDPGLPFSINPMASAETFNNELGASRSFTATAKVLQQAKDWAPVGTEAVVTVTFKKISNDLKSIPGVPASVTKLDADLVYEATFASKGAELTALGLSKRTVYFVNTSTRQLIAALDDSGKLSPVDKKPLPPNMAILK